MTIKTIASPDTLRSRFVAVHMLPVVCLCLAPERYVPDAQGERERTKQNPSELEIRRQKPTQPPQLSANLWG